MNIGFMEERQLDKLVLLERLCFDDPWTTQMLREDFENPLTVYLAATEGEELVGYCAMWRVLDEGHITNLAVAPPYRRSGLGNALLQRLLRLAREEGILSVLLEVRRSNLAAQSLYRKNGFAVLGVRRNYYGATRTRGPEDAVLMKLDLGKE